MQEEKISALCIMGCIEVILLAKSSSSRMLQRKDIKRFVEDDGSVNGVFSILYMLHSVLKLTEPIK